MDGAYANETLDTEKLVTILIKSYRAVRQTEIALQLKSAM